MRDVNGGPDVEVITTPQVVVGYQPTDKDLEIYRFLVEVAEEAGYAQLALVANQMGRRIFGVKF